MTNEEALQYFKEVEFIDKWGPDEAGNGDPLIQQADEARLSAIEALERQIPQKVEQLRSRIYDSDNETCGFIITTYCGNCKEHLKGHIVFYKYDYCPHCGQRIDWGDNHDTQA